MDVINMDIIVEIISLERRSFREKCYMILRFLLIIVPIIYFVFRFILSVNEENGNSFDYGPIRLRRILSLPTEELLEHYDDINCSKPSILAFPSDGFTPDERRHGWIILHITLMFYGFWSIATICDDYLVPSIEKICSNKNIQRDVIGATFMAAAVSSPELFMNFIGTFITKGDIGVGTIIGSAMFNVLAVPACCGLFAVKHFRLEWWPITRDCLMYFAAALILIGILWDGQVWWYEALMLIIAYFGYMLIMHYQKKICRCFRHFKQRFGYFKPNYTEVNEFSHLLNGKNNNQSRYEAYGGVHDLALNSSHMMLYLEQQEEQVPITSPWHIDSHQSRIEYICFWPITFLLWLTVPNCRYKTSRKYLTLFMSIIWIAAICYMMAFAITIIGDTFHIPDAVMGLTILAASMSIPKAVSSIIVTKQGHGGMGLSNSLGSNTFDILLNLGLPWFIKSFFLSDTPGQGFLTFNSESLIYAALLLLTSVMCLYVVFMCCGFTLRKSFGIWCVTMYVGFMILTTLAEFNVFFPINLPHCRH